MKEDTVARFVSVIIKQMTSLGGVILGWRDSESIMLEEKMMRQSIQSFNIASPQDF